LGRKAELLCNAEHQIVFPEFHILPNLVTLQMLCDVLSMIALVMGLWCSLSFRRFEIQLFGFVECIGHHSDTLCAHNIVGIEARVQTQLHGFGQQLKVSRMHRFGTRGASIIIQSLYAFKRINQTNEQKMSIKEKIKRWGRGRGAWVLCEVSFIIF
jgi:hypothetical protein